jgi:hypothetical protein
MYQLCGAAPFEKAGAFSAAGTHQPALHAAFIASRGPVVEFGMGYFSTPMLHELSEASGRRLFSLDTDAAWVDRFRWMTSKLHRVIHVEPCCR